MRKPTVLEIMERAGGVLDARRLVAFTSRRKVRTALARGVIVRDSRGRYALPGAEEARRAAHRLNGVLAGKSAAQHYGWAMKTSPTRPEVTVPRGRKVSPERRLDVDLHWRDIPAEDALHGVLRPVPAVIDCARRHPFDEALSIANSAVKCGDVTQDALVRAAEAVTSTGRAEARRVARWATGKADNPFESTLFAIGEDVPGLQLEPQVDIYDERRWLGRADLVDERLRLVVEAESFEYHGRRKQLERDCVRYNAFALAGWRVLRFSWEQVMFRPGYVRKCLEAAVALPPPVRPRGRTALPRPGRRAA
jgi:very-short-patch-repair endonuclease